MTEHPARLMTKELQALQDADFGWVQSLDSVWSSDDKADGGENQDHVDRLIAELPRLTKSPNPPGRVFLGQAGIGKTHLVGVLRRRVWAEGCWFVMLDVIGITDFWKSAALSFLTSLLQEMPGGQRQYEAVIAGVARRFKIEKEVEIAFASPTIEPKRIVDLLVKGLMRTDMANALEHRDVFRALAFLRSHDLATVSLAHAWLQGYDADETMRKDLGFLMPPPAPIQIVRGLMWVMGLAGPTLVAVDQIDGVLSASIDGVGSEFGETPDFTKLLSGGLLDLSRKVNRGMIVLTCLFNSWEIIKSKGPTSLHQSFAAPVPLRLAQGGAFVRKLIADRLAPAYAAAGAPAQTPTWPFTEAAILSASNGMTPRTILMRCDEHRKLCLSKGKVIPCETLTGSRTIKDDATPPEPDGFDAAFAAAAASADLDGLLDDKDDGKLGMLLRDAFDLYTKQIPSHDDYDVVAKADPAQKTPPLHGRLAFIDHRANDRELHFCFRALQHSAPVALCARFRAALTASGISAKLAGRKLIIVRRGPPPKGPTTKELFSAFRAAGGIEIDPSDADLRRFLALRQMRDKALAASAFDAFERWLVERKPLCDTTFFETAGLCPPPLPPWDGAANDGSRGIAESSAGRQKDASKSDSSLSAITSESQGSNELFYLDKNGNKCDDGLHDLEPANPHSYYMQAVNAGIARGMSREASMLAHYPQPHPKEEPITSIPIGHRLTADAEPVSLPTSILPRHIAIIAGAGSGKTVLLRRIVEEAALAGIPAIVIDPNNDLSRLGDSWPERPSGFSDEDATKASRYKDSVEVVIWTPGIHAGNPLFLSVLPDFSALGDDPDERAQAVTMASDTLGPLADAKNNRQKGVLADALRAFATKGGSLQDMIGFLEDLPEGVSSIGNAGTLAAKMADELKASIATNPLLKATGPVLDPKLLFFGKDPARTRVSVINLSGLASDDAKQDFVNRLQMTLFGWIKKHPSPKGMLYVIDEAQNFIPSGAGALSKTSGVQLVAQARKYGLGMIVVTQAPKGIDNKVVSNCTTQFLGKQNAPTDQATVKEMVAATGGKADDIGKLNQGQFYFKTEASGKPVKIRTPICLTHHPANPPTPEEVVVRAKRSAP